MVAIGSDLGEELSDPRLCPVSAYHWQNVPQHVRLRDCPINVRYHHLKGFDSKSVQLHVMQIYSACLIHKSRTLSVCLQR